MTTARPIIACLGAGRMGRGIAVAFAYAGHAVIMIDVKARSSEQFSKLEAEARGEVGKTLASLARFGLLAGHDADAILARVSVVPAQDMAAALSGAGLVFEGVPEVVDLKREVLAAAAKYVGPDVVIASTTSTILVDDLAGAVENPERFLNVHWLNPAYLIPLVEISPGAATDPDVIARVKALLEGIGKVPVVCAATPGFIVPRIQALAMNEAARMVEEGVASAEDIDKAIRYGFGFRYAVLGLLEFIDWGGGDILYYASRYLEGALQSDRYRAPEVIATNMRDGRIGMRTGAGFLDYSGLDLDAYREKRLAEMVELLRHFGLARPPVLDRDSSPSPGGGGSTRV
ncbi:MAG: 3-hydroxybutyryl-CoA dehydrogenase [Pseudomonadota bacterium]